jgi:hypothetical protein
VYFKRPLCNRYRTRYTKNLRYLRVISRSVRPYYSYIILPSTFGTSSYPSTRSSVYPFPCPTLPTLRYPRYGIRLRYVANKKKTRQQKSSSRLYYYHSTLYPSFYFPSSLNLLLFLSCCFILLS